MLLMHRQGRWQKPAPFFFLGFLFVSTAVFAQSLRLTLEHLARAADVIVMARVENITSHQSGNDSNITTQIELTVIERWKGPITSVLIVTQPGGSAGTVTQAVPGTPQFNLGEEVILFLQGTHNGLYRLVGGRQGKLLVKMDPQTQHQITEDVTGKIQPLEEFVRNLKHVLNKT